MSQFGENNPGEAPSGLPAARRLEIPEDVLSPAMEELADALGPLVPDPDMRLSIVNDCFRMQRADAPYVLAIQALTGASLTQDAAAEVWKATLDLQQHWSARVGEVMSLKSAAIEALDRGHRSPPAASPSTSIREYLDRDILTGLYPRSHYDSALRELASKASREDPLSLLLLQATGIHEPVSESNPAPADVQDSGAVEDAYRRIGQTLRHLCQSTDMPCRFGADYFAVLMPKTSLARSEAFAHELIAALKQAPQQSAGAASLELCAGLAVSQGGVPARSLESAASDALTQARQKGPWSLIASVAGASTGTSLQPVRELVPHEVFPVQAPVRNRGPWPILGGIVLAAAVVGGAILAWHPGNVASSGTPAGAGRPAVSTVAAPPTSESDNLPHEYLATYAPPGAEALQRAMANMPAGLRQEWKQFGGTPANTIIARGGDTHVALFAHPADGKVWHIWQTWPHREWWNHWDLLGTVPGARMDVGLTKDHKGLEVLVKDSKGTTWRVGEVNPNTDKAYWGKWQIVKSE